MKTTELLTILTLVTTTLCVPSSIRRDPSGNKVVITQLFEWTWDSIASECTAFLGPAGYGFVQVSPPQETITGTQWWTSYQPVSYTLVGKRGNQDQFQNMVTTCHAAGVKVIVDTIWNHMSGQSSGTGTAGSSFEKYSYPAVPYGFNDFHHCNNGNMDQIQDYNNATDVQWCELVFLPDLATEMDWVRGHLAFFSNNLIALGVDGLRLDAAKHIPSADIANIISRLSEDVYITQETTYDEGQPITPNQYIPNGDVQEFRYTKALRDAFLGGDIASLRELDNRGWAPSSSVNAFVANHDTERTGDSLNYQSPSNTYNLAMIFSLAHPYGTPTILSSYVYGSDTDQGAPNGGTGTCSNSGGSNGWICQHRTLGGMVGFRNTVGAAALTNWASPSPQQIAFGRGTLGFVAINNADTAWTATFTAGLLAGTYCNVAQIAVPVSNGVCTSTSYTVSSGGSFTATISARSAVAFHAGARV